MKRVHRRTGSASPWFLASEFVGGIIVGIGAGYLWDHARHTAPWGTLAGSLAGFVVGVWNVWKSFRRALHESSSRDDSASED